jgi:signal transduction histidine kinase
LTLFPMRSTSRFLILLLALTVALAAMLAFEAQRATRSHRVTAERALRDYATVAAWEFLTATGEALDRTLGQAFGPVLGTPAASPYDSLPSPAAFAAGASAMLPCGPSGGAERFTFLLDLRSGALTTDGPASAPARAWLRDSVTARSGRGTPAAGRAELLWGDGAVAVYGIKVLRYSGFAQHDAPVAAYGVVTCPDALLPIFTHVMREHPLLPGPVAGGVSNADLVSLRVSGPGGRRLFESGRFPEGGFEGDSASSGAGSLVVAASLPPEIAGRLVVASPRSRLPLLFGLLALAAGLAAVAVRQLRREQELARLRADFTSSVSHELRTPLTQVLLFAETLELGRASGEDARRQALAIIVQEARRLTHLVENVLQFSRAERRLTRVSPEPLPLAPLVRETVERFEPLAGAAAVRLRTELDETLLAAVHAESLHQILLNLLDNAVKHGGPGGAIVLRTRLWQGQTRIEVEDAGGGIPVADRERVWEPYVRLGTAAAGSGIGLAVVRDLVHAHGGRCWIEDGDPGGARFVVELPGGERMVEQAAPERARMAEE